MHIPFQIIFSDTRNLARLGGHRGLIYHYCRIWALALRWLRASPTHTYTPLWDNSNLYELLTLPDVDLWINRGVIYLYQVMDNMGVKSFQHLKIAFDLPNSMFFRFLQLHHVLQSQFGNASPDLTSVHLVDLLLGEDPKKLTSICYSSLTWPAAVELSNKLRGSWEADVGELEEDEWTDALAASLSSII